MAEYNVQEYPGVMNLKNWKSTGKKKYEIYVCMPKLGTKVHNKLENSDYETNEQRPFVLSGTVGEQWVIDMNKLFKTYQLPSGAPLNLDYLKTKGHPCSIDWFKIQTQVGAGRNWAFFVPKKDKVAVPTSWGEILMANRPGIPHGAGDFLVCADNNGTPNLNDMWVVNGAVFATTYDMRAFPKFSTGVASEAPYPKSIVRR